MTQRLLAWNFGLAAALALAAVLAAASQARIFGIVVDAEGEPLEGVKITVRALEVEDETVRITNAKGKYTIVLLDATRSFTIRLEKDGYQPVEQPLRPKIGDVLRQTWTMYPTAGAPTAAPPTGESGDVTGAASGRLARLYQGGLDALKKEEVDKAIEKFGMVVAENPEIAQAHTGLALSYLKKGEPEQALVSAERALELKPDEVLAARVRFQAFRDLGDSEGEAAALAVLEELDPGPETARLVFNTGVALVQAGDVEAAAQRFERSLELNPDLAPAYSALATVYLNLQSYDKAIAKAKSHLELEPDSAHTLGVLYVAYRAQGDEARAEETWAALAATGSTFVGEGFLEFGVYQYNGGDLEEARLIFARILEIHPDHALATYYLGRSLLSLGDVDRARELLERFVGLEPDHPEAATAREMLANL